MMLSRWKIFFIAVLTLGVFVLIGFGFTEEQQHQYFPLKRIAHAAGGYDGKTITNSIDALNYNKNNFDFFEIDFEWTSDNKLVCIHDWKKSAVRAFGRAYDTPPSFAEFEKLVSQNEKYKNCTAKTLVEWLKANPKKKVVTDVKKDNLRALAYLIDFYPEAKSRIIPQIYHPDEYDPVRSMGYDDIIFTLYRFSRSHEEALQAVQGKSLYAITISAKNVRGKAARKLRKAGLPYKFIKGNFSRKMAEMNIPTYVHTVNSEEEWKQLKDIGVSEIYTDWLIP